MDFNKSDGLLTVNDQRTSSESTAQNETVTQTRQNNEIKIIESNSTLFRELNKLYCNNCHSCDHNSVSCSSPLICRLCNNAFHKHSDCILKEYQKSKN
jgi:hypothetical protein